MTVASIANAKNQTANSLVAARSSKGPFANALASAGSALGAKGAAPPAPVGGKLTYDQSLAKAQDKLSQWFKAAGVDTSSDIQLTLRADGTVQLANDPPDADKIQQVLSSHPELTSMMKSLADSYRQTHPETQPGASTETQFTLTLSGNQATGSLE